MKIKPLTFYVLGVLIYLKLWVNGAPTPDNYQMHKTHGADMEFVSLNMLYPVR